MSGRGTSSSQPHREVSVIKAVLHFTTSQKQFAKRNYTCGQARTVVDNCPFPRLMPAGHTPFHPTMPKQRIFFFVAITHVPWTRGDFDDCPKFTAPLEGGLSILAFPVLTVVWTRVVAIPPPRTPL